VVQGAAGDQQVPVVQGQEGREVVRDALIQHLPAEPVVVGRGGLDGGVRRVDQEIADVGPGVFEDDLDAAGFQVVHRQGAGVAAAAVYHKKSGAGAVEAQGRGGIHVLRGDLRERLPLVRHALEDAHAAGGLGG